MCVNMQIQSKCTVSMYELPVRTGTFELSMPEYTFNAYIKWLEEAVILFCVHESNSTISRYSLLCSATGDVIPAGYRYIDSVVVHGAYEDYVRHYWIKVKGFKEERQ